MIMISKEAEEVLFELLEHESDGSYWVKKFTSADHRTRTILSGCFKELEENKLISAIWADSVPIHTEIQKDGYLYQQHKKEQEKAEKALTMSDFEKQLEELLVRAKEFSASSQVSSDRKTREEQEMHTDVWMNDVRIFQAKYLKSHPLSSEFATLLFHRNVHGIIAALTSISKDTDYINKMNGAEKVEVPKYQAKTLPEYDVFLSHANKDKEDLIEDLYQSLSKLGISIFYDKESIEWGDEWKKRILNSTKKAEFAIIVISENFFDREWTERELSEFLNRQNRNGQKLILPIIHNITTEQLKAKYPNVAGIQAIDSKKYNCDQITLLFARQLIKRLKTE